jgi:hypothetical protein
MTAAVIWSMWISRSFPVIFKLGLNIILAGSSMWSQIFHILLLVVFVQTVGGKYLSFAFVWSWEVACYFMLYRKLILNALCPLIFKLGESSVWSFVVNYSSIYNHERLFYKKLPYFHLESYISPSSKGTVL